MPIPKSRKMRVCDAAVEILKETDNQAVMWGDTTLLYKIAERAGISMVDRHPFDTAERVIKALACQPGILLKSKTLSHSRSVRIFRLPADE